MKHTTNRQLSLFDCKSKAECENKMEEERPEKSRQEAKIVSLKDYKRESEEREAIQWILANTKSF